MTTFVYELEDDRSNHRTLELNLPFSGEWSQQHSIVQGDLTSDSMVILNAVLADHLVSEIFQIDLDYSTAFVIHLKKGEICNADFEFEIFSEYDFDSDDSIRQKFVSKVESSYSVDSVRIVE